MVVVKTVKDYVDEEGNVDKEKKKLAVKKAMKEFAIKNERHLVRLFHYMTGIYDRDIVHDAVYELYLRIMQQEVLDLYDETLKDAASYETYITNLFCWLMPFLSRKNFRHRHVPMPEKYQDKGKGAKKKMYDYYLSSHLSEHEKHEERWEDDIFEYVNRDKSYLRVDPVYEASVFDYEENPVFSGYLADFKNFIRKTESSRTAEKMIVYLDQKLSGNKGVVVADMLGISNNMVKIIRHSLQRKYTQWQAVES